MMLTDSQERLMEWYLESPEGRSLIASVLWGVRQYRHSKWTAQKVALDLAVHELDPREEKP